MTTLFLAIYSINLPQHGLYTSYLSLNFLVSISENLAVRPRWAGGMSAGVKRRAGKML